MTLKINYISYFDPRLHRGGGEMIAADVIEAGLMRGHTFTFSSVRPKISIDYDEISWIWTFILFAHYGFMAISIHKRAVGKFCILDSFIQCIVMVYY